MALGGHEGMAEDRNKQCPQSCLNTVTAGPWRVTQREKASWLERDMTTKRAEKFGGVQLLHRMPLHHPAPGLQVESPAPTSPPVSWAERQELHGPLLSVSQMWKQPQDKPGLDSSGVNPFQVRYLSSHSHIPLLLWEKMKLLNPNLILAAHTEGEPRQTH